MKIKLMTLLTCLLMSLGLATAQVRTVQGVVLEESGLPVVGASVVVDGTTQGTVTDLDGNFIIENVKPSAKTITVSYIGMQTQKLKIKSGKMKIVLKADTELLDEVMVVAYGTQKKSSFTGSAASMKTEKLEKMQVSNLSKGLEGAMAGVQTASSSGTPGSGAAIRIRGIGSISSSQSPLIVVDGVPYEGSLNSIATQDIANLTVLKDAAANSMYGARGSNGVILITTKGSKAGKPKINFDARVGVNKRGVPAYDIISNPGEYYEMFYEAYVNRMAGDIGYANARRKAAENIITEQLKYNIYKGVADNNIIDWRTGKLTAEAAAAPYLWNETWKDDAFETGMRQEYNINASGGTENTKAYVSLGYLKDEGYMPNSGFERFNARVRLDQKFGDNVTIGANMSYAHTDQKTFGSTKSNFSNIFMFSQMIAPIYPIYEYDAEGNIVQGPLGDMYDFGEAKGRPYAGSVNPLAQAVWGDIKKLRDNLTTRGYMRIDFLEDFTFTTNVAFDVFNTHGNNYMTPIAGDAKNVNGRGYKDASRFTAVNFNQLLDWDHTFGSHNVHIKLGHEIKNDKDRTLKGSMTNFVDPFNPEFSNAAAYSELTSYADEYALEGYFIQASYNYRDTYYLTSSYRRDGSSRFHKDNRWGDFWAIGGSWRMKQESFLRDLEWLDNLKLKASFGTQGNDNVGYPHNYIDLYSVGRVNNEPALSRIFRGNPDLSWEKSDNFNIGVEAGFLSKFTVDLDFFVKKTKDMLYAKPLPSSEGSPAWIYENVMDMKNTGVEFTFDALLYKNKDITWRASFNATHYKNELTKLVPGKPETGYQVGSYWRKKGGSLYDFYLYEYAGVDPETGSALYNKYELDEDNYPILDTRETTDDYSKATRVQTNKSSIPDVTGGFSTSIDAYGFDLSVQTAYQIGGYVMDSSYAGLMNSGFTGGTNIHRDMFDRWTPANKDSNIPMLLSDSQNQGITGMSDFFLTDASYFAIKNITLGYTIPQNLVKKAGFEKCRVYMAGDNVWLKSKRKGLDPRQGFGGGTGYIYSALSSYSIGLNLTF